MEREAFNLLRNMERSWWYRGRSLVLSRILARTHQKPETILDFGAGWGGMYTELAKNGAKVYAFEPDPEARRMCQQRGYVHIFSSVEEALAQTYDCISLLDVLEHIEDDATFLQKARSALTQNGVLLLSVPAFQFLWSPHDVLHQHFRRYSAPVLTQRLTENGYHVVAMSYWNTVLSLPAMVVRLLRMTGEGSLSLPRLLDALLYAVVWTESLVLRVISLPFGTGLVALAAKSKR